jgi:hypothetical protein
MEDKFDKIFSTKVKEVVEKRELPYNPAHWNMLLTKKKQNKKRLLIYWQVAAFLLVAVLAGGIGNYFFTNSRKEQHDTPKIILDKINDSLRVDSIKNNDKIIITSSDFDSINKFDLKVSKVDTKNTESRSKSISKKYIKTEEAIVSKENKYNAILNDKFAKVLNDSVSMDTNSIINNLKNEYDKITQITDIELNKDSISNKSAIAIADKELNKDSLFTINDIALLEEMEKDSELKTKKPVKLGFGVSPSYNYNQESESSNVGFAGGITVDIPISNKFDINTGVLYADQTIDLIKPTNVLSDVVSSKSSKQSSQLVEKEAIIKGVEIPLNLKYNFSIDKKDLFVSVGVTSTSYIKENIEEKYLVNNRLESSSVDTFGNNIVRYELEQTNSKVVTPSDSKSFNFANILNLSFGVELPINNQQQSIIIEPYFKYSLIPVTQQNLDFSSVGVHLRYNFSFKIKN